MSLVTPPNSNGWTIHLISNFESLDVPKSILETEETLKTLSSGQMCKKTKKPKKPTGLVFFFFNRVFSNPGPGRRNHGHATRPGPRIGGRFDGLFLVGFRGGLL
jgi:hypothetical protein